MEQIVLILHVLAALAIIGLIMIQQGKGADMGASFGAGASQTLFGSGGGGNILTTSTAWLVTLFFATSFSLAVIAKNQSVAANAVDLPAPVVVESQFEPIAGDGDIPAIDNTVIGDIPAIDNTVISDDIPTIETPAAAESDIPEL